MSLPIPSAALDDRLAFVGTAGSGKTYNAGSGVERLLSSGARVVIPDPLGVWYGLALAADGKGPSVFRQKEKLVIFGGPRGDLPLTEHAGALIGETVAGMAESCIIDLSDIGTNAGERRFMLAFLTALYKHKTKEPLHVVFDEADMWAPQKVLDKEGEANKLLGMMQTVVRRGRVRGFIPWLITQRPAVLSKDVLSQIDGLVAFKLTASQDRDAIGDWVQGQADKKQWQEIWAQLPTMERGTGVVWLPARGVLKTAAFPEKSTFDSSRTPKRGERVQRAGSLQPVNIDKLKERLAAVESEAKANDPRKLRAEIASLKAERAKLETQVVGAKASVPDKEAIAAAEKRGFEQAEKKLKHAGEAAARELIAAFLDSLSVDVSTVTNALRLFQGGIADKIKDFRKQKVSAEPIAFVPAPRLAASSAPRPAAPTSRPSRPPKAEGAPSTLAKGERACLIAIAQHANGVTREQLTVLTGYKRSSRDTYIQRLGASGFVGFSSNRIMATPEGIVALGDDYQPLPTGDALRALVLARLPQGERVVLQKLVDAYPNAVPRDALTEMTGYQRSSRDTYLQRLSARELVETIGRGEVKASDNLFGEAA